MAPMPSKENIALIKQAVLKSRQDFANRQKNDLDEVLKQSEQEHLACVASQIENEDTKRVIEQSIRE